MINERFFSFIKSQKIILVLILCTFFLKGVFLVVIQPIFTGQDEARHYDTVQYFAEPKNAVPETEKITKKNYDEARDKDNFNTYNFTEEIQKTAQATNTDIIRGDMFNTIDFSRSYNGENETTINLKTWKPYNYYAEPDIAGTSSLYHKATSHIEKWLSDQTILTRFYTIRIFSALLGTITLFFCYLTARTIGFSSYVSLILTALISFQPKFSLYFTNINYDVLLIPMFFLFTYAGVRTLKHGLTWRNILLLVAPIIIATETKATGYILVIIFVALITFLLYKKVEQQTKYFRYSVYGICSLVALFIMQYLYSHFLVSDLSLVQRMESLFSYLSKTITFGKFIMPSDTYWGILGWTNNAFLWTVPWGILLLELLALFGLGLLFFSKTFSQSYPSFLPAKKYILFLIGMIVALQLGVRIADWSAFSRLGSMTMSLGTPGRYFLPNLSAHILLMATGLGALLAYTKKERYFETILLGLLILMFSLMMYLTFNALILRFYF
ncbi:MAG: glycosyltransferase family 39 protein [Candidatus Pacebacteria bacterium]|nr:glycosyltransferase family 39 protein [Candidatus Paceibacterota bacterium]